MNIEKILNSGLINTADLARRLWPDNKNPKSKMSAKLANANGQRLTEKDKADIEMILSDFFEAPKKTLTLIGLLLVILINTSFTFSVWPRWPTCHGKANCHACKNCKNCKYCNKYGGTCGVCKRTPKRMLTERDSSLYY